MRLAPVLPDLQSIPLMASDTWKVLCKFSRIVCISVMLSHELPEGVSQMPSKNPGIACFVSYYALCTINWSQSGMPWQITRVQASRVAKAPASHCTYKGTKPLHRGKPVEKAAEFAVLWHIAKSKLNKSMSTHKLFYFKAKHQVTHILHFPKDFCFSCWYP